MIDTFGTRRWAGSLAIAALVVAGCTNNESVGPATDSATDGSSTSQATATEAEELQTLALAIPGMT